MTKKKKKGLVDAESENPLNGFFEDCSIPSSSTHNQAPKSRAKAKKDKVSQLSTSALIICRNKYVQLCKS
jgi:hypothetical protein